MSRDPWERQPKETDKSWEAFVKYRDMGAERSHVRLEQVLGKNKNYLAVWSKRNDWVERCAAYDNHVDQLALKEIEREYIRSAKMRAKSAMMTYGRGTERLGRISGKKLSASDALKMQDQGRRHWAEEAGHGGDVSQPLINIDARKQVNVQVNINEIKGEDYKEILALERELGFVRKLKPGDNGNGVGGNGKH